MTVTIKSCNFLAAVSLAKKKSRPSVNITTFYVSIIHLIHYILAMEKTFVKRNIYHEQVLCPVNLHVPYVSISTVLSNKKFSCSLLSAELAPKRQCDLYKLYH